MVAVASKGRGIGRGNFYGGPGHNGVTAAHNEIYGIDAFYDL